MKSYSKNFTEDLFKNSSYKTKFHLTARKSHNIHFNTNTHFRLFLLHRVYRHTSISRARLHEQCEEKPPFSFPSLCQRAQISDEIRSRWRSKPNKNGGFSSHCSCIRAWLIVCANILCVAKRNRNVFVLTCARETTYTESEEWLRFSFSLFTSTQAACCIRILRACEKYAA